jgi:hypothetical protein
MLDQLDDLTKNDGLKKYVERKFGGVDQCRKKILGKNKTMGI